MSIETIRVSEAGRDQLITLKRRTGIEHWNVLCRWALCTSLAEPNEPPNTKVAKDSNLEMSWRVLGGKYADLYLALIKQRCIDNGLGVNDETLRSQFRLHLHRGISYLAGDRKIQCVSDLIARAR